MIDPYRFRYMFRYLVTWRFFDLVGYTFPLVRAWLVFVSIIKRPGKKS